MNHQEMAKGTFRHLLHVLLERRVDRRGNRVRWLDSGHALLVRLVARHDGLEHVPLRDEPRAPPEGRAHDARRARSALIFAGPLLES